MVKAKKGTESFFFELINKAFLAHQLDPKKQLPRPQSEYAVALGLNETDVKEKSVFKYAQQDAKRDGNFHKYLPHIYGIFEQPNQYILVEEDLSQTLICHDYADISSYDNTTILDALRDFSNLHGIWFNREEQLKKHINLGKTVSWKDMSDATELWELCYLACANHMEDFINQDQLAVHRQLLDSLDTWWPTLDAMPKTLIYGDTVPRNISLRYTKPMQLVLFDWEVPAYRPPQQDIAELLCYLTADKTTDAEIMQRIEVARRQLETAANTNIDKQQWQQGIVYSLANLLISRLSIQTTCYVIIPRADISRVYSTWHRLYDLLS